MADCSFLSCGCFTKPSDRIPKPVPRLVPNQSSTNIFDIQHNKSIEKHMSLAQKKEENTIRILLLGPGSSGKTTILKQITKIHSDDADEEVLERKKITKYIKDAIIEYMKILCYQSVELHEKHQQSTLVHQENEYLRKEMMELEAPYALTQQNVHKMKILWDDEGIRNTLEQRSFYQIHDNVAYFLDRLDAIVASEYIPSFEDYIRFRLRSTGFNQRIVTMKVDNFGEHRFEFTDVGGQRSERGKWMKLIKDDINAVLYILAISDYDLTLFEDNKTNRLIESIDLFRDIMIKGNFFQKKTVILFFNKYDLFKEKITKTPITVAFKDFPVDDMNPNDANDVVRYVAGKFLKVFQNENVKLSSPLHIVRTTALDTNNIEKIFADITLDLVQQDLKLMGIM